MAHLEMGLDLETTGIEIGDHRIVEVYAGIYYKGRLIKALDQRIDPERAISVDAQRVHGISAADLFGKPKWPVIAPVVAQWIDRVDHIVWHNGEDFDGPFLKHELERVGVQMPVKPSTDTMRDGLWATPDGKKPNLGELCLACGIPYDPALAHAASYDVQRMMDCYFAARAWGYYRHENETEGLSRAA